VLLLSGILAAIGVGVSAGFIAAGGGFTPDGPSILDPPSEEDIWEVGTNIQDGTFLEYSVDARGLSSALESATVSMDFEDAGDLWNVTFTIANGTGQEITKTVPMSEKLTKEGQIEKDFMTYFEPVENSILAVRDMDYGGRDKYLVVGARWDTIFYQSSQLYVSVTARETVQTPGGSFDSFLLSYTLEEKTSRIWMVKGFPLPVKAEVYDVEDSLLYRFDLVEVSGIVHTSDGTTL
jgi:hypothetical protein